MLIGSKLPPEHGERTFFNSGRAAFAFLIDQVIRPRKVYLPTFTCWSLVSAMQRRFPQLALEFYPVDRDLQCQYPASLAGDEALVFIHFFGYENATPLPTGDGVMLEDWSHAYLSQINARGHYVFGSYRKIMKVGDGGFINSYFNPAYEPSRKLDTWLRYESSDWRDVREAENMMDRDWQIADISSQSLAILIKASEEWVRRRRRANEGFLAEHLNCGRALRPFQAKECPLLHSRLFDTSMERDSLRQYLASRGVYTSIHWPTHPRVKEATCDIEAALWLEGHIICIPVSHDYGLNDMEYVVKCTDEWKRAGG